MQQAPFNDFLGQYLVQILSPRREAAFLYDAVKLYSKSLKESLENGEDVFNGTRIIERLKNRSYTRYKTLVTSLLPSPSADTKFVLSILKLSCQFISFKYT